MTYFHQLFRTWFTKDIKIGRQYHGCPKAICLLISATIWNQHGSHYCTSTTLTNALTQINNQCGVDQHCQCWSAALLSVGLRQGWERVLISIDHRSVLIHVNHIDQQSREWISVGLRQGSAGEAKLPKLSRVSFACKQARAIIWKIYFHKDRKMSM